MAFTKQLGAAAWMLTADATLESVTTVLPAGAGTQLSFDIDRTPTANSPRLLDCAGGLGNATNDVAVTIPFAQRFSKGAVFFQTSGAATLFLNFS